MVAPYRNASRTIVGAAGVIGPTRLNYGRIVPIVSTELSRVRCAS